MRVPALSAGWLIILMLGAMAPAVAQPRNNEAATVGHAAGQWVAASPADTGFDAIRLDAAIRQIGSMDGVYSVLVVRGGKLVTEAYFRDGYREKPHNLKSASKSLISALVGIAIEEGFLDLDQPVRELLPYPDIFSDPKKSRITVRHLLTMTSGLVPVSYQTYNAWIANDDWVKAALGRPMVAEPGTRFQYSTGNTHILSGILTAATGMNTREYAERKLFGPLGITLHGWDEDPMGIPVGGNNLSITPRDMAKLGLLYLDGGRFGDRQIVPRWWVVASTRPSESGDHAVYGKYGFLWYTRPGGHQAFAAVGYGGQYIYVAPPENCVVVVTATLDSKGPDWEKALFSQFRSGILGSLRIRPSATETVDMAIVDDAGGRGSMPRVVARTLPPSDTAPVESGVTATPPRDAAAESTVMGTTLANVVLRETPEIEGIRLDLIPLETEVPILENRGQWHRVRYKRHEGWISGDYVRLSAYAPAQSAAVAKASGHTRVRLNLRRGPGENHPVVSTLPSGTELVVEDHQDRWVRVVAGNRSGWVYGEYIRIAAAPSPEPDVLAALSPVSETPPAVSAAAPPDPVSGRPAPGSLPSEADSKTPSVAPSDQTPYGQQIVELDKRLAQIRRSETDAAAARQALRETIRSVNGRIDALSQQYAENTATLDALAAAVRTAQENAARRQSWQDTAQDARKATESGLALALSRTAAMMQTVERLKNEQAHDRARYAGAEKQQRDTAAAMGQQFQKQLDELQGKITTLQDGLVTATDGRNALASTLEGIKATVAGQREALHRDETAARQEIREQINTARSEIDAVRAGLDNAEEQRRRVQAKMDGLEKAVDRQRAVTETVAATLDGFGKEMAAVNRHLDDTRKTIDQMQTSGSALALSVAEIRKGIDSGEKQRRETAARQKIQEQISAARSEIDAVRTGLDNAAAQRRRVQAKMDGLEKAVDRQRAVTETVAAALDGFGKEMAAVNRRLDDTRKAIDQMQTSGSALALSVAEIRKGIDSGEKQRRETAARQETQEQISAARSEIDAVRTGLDNAAEQRRGVQAKMDGLEMAVDRQRAVTETVAAALDGFGKEMAAVNRRLDDTRKTVESHGAGSTRLEQALAAIQQRLDENSGRQHEVHAGQQALHERIEAARHEIETLHGGATTAVEERQRLFSRLTALERSLADQGQLAQTLDNTSAAFSTQLAAAGQRLEKIEKALEIKGGTADGFRSAVGDIRKTLASHQAADTALTAANQRLAQRLDAALDEIRGLKESLAEADKITAALSDQGGRIDSGERARQSLAADLARAHEQMAAISRSLAMAGSGQDALQGALSALREELTSQRQAMERIATETNAWRSQLTAVKTRLDTVAEALDEGRDHRTDLVRSLTDVQQELAHQRQAAAKVQKALTDRVTAAGDQLAVLAADMQKWKDDRSTRNAGTIAGKRQPAPAASPAQGPAAERTASPEGKPAAKASPPMGRPPTEPIPSETDRTHEIAAVVAAWAQSWSQQDTEAYLANYSSRFRPADGMSLKAWIGLRRQRLTRPGAIRISIENLRHITENPEKAKATFLQTYRSDTYQDRVIKTLDLVLEDNRWKIIGEFSKPAPPG